MQREQISIPKMLAYAVLIALFYAIQTRLGVHFSIRGFHLDVLPCFVAAAALLDGPMEGAVVGLLIGLIYDLGGNGVEGLYPLYFMLFGLAAGGISRNALSSSCVSVMIMTLIESVLLGILRYFGYLLPMYGASFLLVLRQVVAASIITMILSFVVYLPMRKIGQKISSR